MHTVLHAVELAELGAVALDGGIDALFHAPIAVDEAPGDRSGSMMCQVMEMNASCLDNGSHGAQSGIAFG